MLKLIISFVFFSIWFYLALLTIYFMQKGVNYFFTKEFILQYEIFYRIMPRAMLVSIIYIFLAKLSRFLGLVGEDKK
ncbi:Uncharacterised protein [Avibacterium avium]|uniref:Transmembrane protein n=1 Tax=Avibacterium avium TaxID=751 RepID=A0A379AU67_AVIAV|nr:Uncharacterised protein [Avibacterium avium]